MTLWARNIRKINFMSSSESSDVFEVECILDEKIERVIQCTMMTLGQKAVPRQMGRISRLAKHLGACSKFKLPRIVAALQGQSCGGQKEEEQQTVRDEGKSER